MFTGIVSAIGTIRASEQRGDLRLTIACPYDPHTMALGASIACSGVCLTVVDKGGDWFDVDISAETLSKTNIGASGWAVGKRVNLERALRVGDELGGHIVTGHVDGVGRILKIEPIEPDPDEPWGATARFHIRAPQGLARFIAAKGSICLDGTSLTVNTVEDDVFTVLLIPHSFSVTTWGQRKQGDGVHVEVDLMARYAARLAEARPQG